MFNRSTAVLLFLLSAVLFLWVPEFLLIGHYPIVNELGVHHFKRKLLIGITPLLLIIIHTTTLSEIRQNTHFCALTLLWPNAQLFFFSPLKLTIPQIHLFVCLFSVCDCTSRACSNSCNISCVLEVCGKTNWLCVVLFAALKSPAAFHEQIRSLERARVSTGHYSLVLKSLTQKSANAKRHLGLFAWCDSYVPLRCLRWPELLFVIYTILFFVSVEQWAGDISTTLTFT